MHDIRTRTRAELMRNEFGFSLRAVATSCGVSKSSVAGWSSTSQVKPTPNRKRGPKGFHCSIETAILDSVARNPLTTAAEIANDVFLATGLSVSRTTVYKSLKLIRMSYKIATRSRAHQRITMSHPFFHGNPFAENAMAFDEAGFYINSVPKRGWGPRGQRVPKAPIARSARLSLLLVTDRSGVVASKLLSGGVKACHVADFVATLPQNRPMILDNAAVHRSSDVRAACAASNISMNFLPPYSPWYNPVENAFAQSKAKFQKLRLVSSDFVRDIMDSVANVRNFEGMFESAHRMWIEDSQ